MNYDIEKIEFQLKEKGILKISAKDRFIEFYKREFLDEDRLLFHTDLVRELYMLGLQAIQEAEEKPNA